MSSLIVVHDSRIILLEVAVENLYMPWIDIFDTALMKKTIIMFRCLDEEWTTLMPKRSDYHSYRGSNYENEKFYGGKSVLFSIPETVLEQNMSNVDLQLYVYRGVSKYFELEPRRNFGFTLIKMDNLFNAIIKDLHERKELESYFSSELEREPISRSMRGTYVLLDEDMQKTEATIELYVRISYLGKCIITEIHSPESVQKAFYAREETDEIYRYQFRELTTIDLESFCWGSLTIIPPLSADKLICQCKEEYVAEGTQTKKRKRRKTDLEFWGQLARVQELLDLMKKMRKNRPDMVPLGEKPKKVCVQLPPPCVCPAVCPPVCVYTLPSVCANPCTPTTVCCLSPQ